MVMDMVHTYKCHEQQTRWNIYPNATSSPWLYFERSQNKQRAVWRTQQLNFSATGKRLKFIGHMWRRKEGTVSQMLLWKLKQGARKTSTYLCGAAKERHWIDH
jgi:hypothetical protein